MIFKGLNNPLRRRSTRAEPKRFIKLTMKQNISVSVYPNSHSREEHEPNSDWLWVPVVAVTAKVSHVLCCYTTGINTFGICSNKCLFIQTARLQSPSSDIDFQFDSLLGL